MWYTYTFTCVCIYTFPCVWRHIIGITGGATSSIYVGFSHLSNKHFNHWTSSPNSFFKIYFRKTMTRYEYKLPHGTILKSSHSQKFKFICVNVLNSFLRQSFALAPKMASNSQFSYLNPQVLALQVSATMLRWKVVTDQRSASISWRNKTTSKCWMKKLMSQELGCFSP